MAWEEVPPPRETRPRDVLADVGRAQRAAKLLAGPLFRWYFRMSVSGEGGLPREGPVILAPNHDSMWDVPLLAVVSPRPIVFMAKHDVFSGPVRSRFFTWLGGFPVRRGGRDFDAMRRSLAAVRSGRMLCLYPEGTRHRGPELGPFLPGAAWIALAEGVPIVPVGIRGTDGIWPEGGPGPRRADELTDDLRDRVAALLA